MHFISPSLFVVGIVGKFLLGTIGKLGKDKVFCDIGHGIGNLPIQAAFTHGCESRGIEMVGDRHAIAECLNEFFHTQHKLVSDQSGEVRTHAEYKVKLPALNSKPRMVSYQS